MIERLAQWVGVRSLSGREDALATAVAADLAGHGLEVRRSGNNVWCQIGDAERPRLLLNSHLDTVPPGEGWSGDPWTLRRQGERLIGLGANDAKGCGVAMVQAFLAIQAELARGGPLGGTVVLALSAAEETSGKGLATILDGLRPLDAAIVGEPTGMVPMIAQRGLLILRCVARGRSGHPANTPPDSPDNAIHAAAEDVVRLKAFDWGAAHPMLGRCHCHVTQIAGGVARNVVPDACEFFVDIRTTPNQPHGATVERLRGYLKAEVDVHSDRLGPVETQADEPIVRAVRAALPEAPLSGSPAMSDMVFLAGIPSVKLGPGRSERSHTADEYVTVEELKLGACVYSNIVRTYFGMRD